MHDSLLSPQLFCLVPFSTTQTPLLQVIATLTFQTILFLVPFLKDIGQIQHSYFMRVEKRPGFAELSVDAFLQDR